MGKLLDKEWILSFLKTEWQRLVYFIFVFLFTGTVSIWLPGFLWDSDMYTWKEWTLEIATFATATICSGAVEHILELFGDGANKGRALLCIVSLLIIWPLTFFITVYISNCKECCSKVIAWSMFALAVIVWWIINYDNETLSSTNVLGGDAK